MGNSTLNEESSFQNINGDFARNVESRSQDTIGDFAQILNIECSSEDSLKDDAPWLRYEKAL
jgi:hypothetical protein